MPMNEGRRVIQDSIFSWLVSGLCYFALAKISFLTALPSLPDGPALLWLPTGFAVALVFRQGYIALPGVALGSLLSASSSSLALTIFGFVTANTLDVFLAVWFCRWLLGRNPNFNRKQDALVFVSVVVLMSSVFSATLGASVLYQSGQIPLSEFKMKWLVWWVSDFLSVLILSPFFLAWTERWRGHVDIVKEFVGAAFGPALMLVVFLLPLGKAALHIVYWFLPFVIWHSTRHGRRSAATSVFLLAVVTISATAMGRGPFYSSSPEESYLYLQSFLAVCSIIGLIGVALVGERDEAIRDRDNLLLMASRDLRTPLSVLDMLSQFVNKWSVPGEKDSPSRRMELVKDGLQELSKVNQMVDDSLKHGEKTES